MKRHLLFSGTAAAAVGVVRIVMLISFRAELAMKLDVTLSFDVMLAAFSDGRHRRPH